MRTIRKKRRMFRLLKDAFRTAGADKIISGYFLWFFISAVPIWLWEPNINTYQDSLWFCFASATSIGYGDVVAVTLVGRIITVILSIYSIAAIAIFTAVVTSFFTDIARLKASDSAREFADDLKHLSELSKDELEQLSQHIREYQKKNH